MADIYAILAGMLVGAVYTAIGVKAPAPPIIALAGLAGMLVAAQILGA